MIHRIRRWLRAIAMTLDSLHGGTAMADEKDDEGTVSLGMIVGLAGLASRFIPGKGGDKHLKNCLYELGKFLDARSEAIDQMLDVDG